ncbi:MAG: hypothetical protein LUH22_08240 [Bacteroides sp.]|nr:hypothetical protein [Bacteroides sp.]
MTYAIIGSFLLALLAILSLALLFGAPMGEYALGGKHKVLKGKERFMAVFAFCIQVFGIFVLLRGSGILDAPLSGKAINICLYIYAGYLSLNVLMNLASKSQKEKLIMTPLAAITALCFWFIALQ